mgnify:CR=1 FL=1
MHPSIKNILQSSVFILLVMAIWEYGSLSGWWRPFLFPAPSAISGYLEEAIRDNSLWSATVVTIRRLLLGYLAGISIGIPAGLLSARFQLMRNTIGVLALGFQGLPSVCWVPLAILWFGQEEAAILFVVVMGTVWSVILATENGLANVPPIYARAARTMGAGSAYTLLFVTLPASAPFIVSGMKQVTIEALLRSADWTDGRGDALSSVFGIEGNFLVRIGDADRPRDQLQLATGSANGGNWPAANAAPGLPVNEWVHIAVVWDAVNGERIYYQNGKQVAYSNQKMSGSVTLTGNCYVGKSYNEERYIPGEISELRVWSVARTPEQIAGNMYGVSPESEGLVAYWKFNEGSGSTIIDHANGTNLSAVGGTPTWIPVTLPEIK